MKQAVAQAARGDKRIADAEKTLQELSATKAQYEKEVSEAEDAAADVNAQIAEAYKSEDTRMLEKKEVEGMYPVWSSRRRRRGRVSVHATRE